MRAWDERAEQVAAANARVVVLTPDSPAVARASAQKHGLQTPLHPVDPDVWAGWGLANPKKSKLPHPSTIVVGADGRVIQRITNENYRKRADVDAVLAAIQSGQPAADAPAGPGPTAGPDWAGAVHLEALGSNDGPLLRLEIKPGFHVYGAAETVARPLAVRVAGVPGATAAIPSGTRKVLGGGLGEAWVIKGSVDLAIRDAGSGPWSGELDLQICTDNACSPPGVRAWAVGE